MITFDNVGRVKRYVVSFVRPHTLEIPVFEVYALQGRDFKGAETDCTFYRAQIHDFSLVAFALLFKFDPL